MQPTCQEAREFRHRWAHLCLNSKMEALRELDLAEGSLGGRASPCRLSQDGHGSWQAVSVLRYREEGQLSWACRLPSVPEEVAQEGGSWSPVDAGATLPAAFTGPRLRSGLPTRPVTAELGRRHVL